MRAPTALGFLLSALFLFGCAAPTPPLPLKAASAETSAGRGTVTAQAPAATSQPPARHTITLEWTYTNPVDFTTGIVSATNIAGPWTEETNFPAELTNRWTDTSASPAKFYRAFSR